MDNYSLTEEAEIDLIRIHQWGIIQFGEAKGDAYYDKLVAQFETIASRPLSYAAVDDVRSGYRRCVFGSNSIYFRVINEQVEIMAIIGQQDTDHWL